MKELKSKSEVGKYIIINIDGCDRKKALETWIKLIGMNKDKSILIVVDNSDMRFFEESCNEAKRQGATITNYYDLIQRNIGTKSCTLFMTHNQSML